MLGECSLRCRCLPPPKAHPFYRWEKYNYLTEAGFDVGIAISGLIQTLIFAFSNGGDGISWTWWGNSIATQVSTSLLTL